MKERIWLKNSFITGLLFLLCSLPVISFAESELGIVSFTAASLTVKESDGKASVLIERTGIAKGNLTVRVKAGKASSNTFGRDATEGEDFTMGTTSFTWESGETGAKRIGFTIATDDLEEGDESFSLAIATAGKADIGKIPEMTITIQDSTESRLEPGLINFEPTSYRVKEDAGFVTLAAERSGGSDGVARFSFTVGGGRSDTATAGKDYTAADGELIWDGGESGRKTFTVKVLEDDQREDDESLTVRLAKVSGDASIGQFGTAQIVIEDTTLTPEPGTIQFESSSQTVAENAGELKIRVQRSGGSDGEVSVRYDIGSSNDSATPDEDYKDGSGTLSWSDGDSGDREITLSLLADNIPETDESVTIRLFEPGNSATLGDRSSTVITISDASDFGRLAFDSDAYTVSESEGRISLVIKRIGGSAGRVSVRVGTGGDGDTAESGQDYTAISETVQWEQGDSSDKTVELNVINDSVFEPEEFLTVALTSPEGNAQLGDPSSAKVTIENSTPAANGTVQIQQASYSVEEEDGPLTVAVTRSGGSDGRISVAYSLGADGDTAEAGSDYRDDSGILVWEDGDSSPKSIVIDLVSDEGPETQETLTIVLSELTGGAQFGSNQTATITIGRLVAGEFPIELEIVSGDQQSGFPGDMLEPFVLTVISEGQSASGQTVSWSVSPPEAGRLINGLTTRSDDSGVATNSLEIIDGGVITVTATVETAAATRAAGDEPNVARFTVNAGFAGAADLTPNQRSVGGALDKACNALGNVDALDPGQADLLATCDALKSEDADGISAGLNRLQPEELFAVGTLSIDSADLQVTNVQSRINALRAGNHGLDLASLNIELYGQELPGYVVGAIADELAGGGAGASSDDSFGRLGVFVNGSISVGTLDESENELGLDFDSQSITAGVDYRVSDSLVVGGALGVLTHTGDYSAEGGKIELGSTSLTAFVTWYNEDKAYIDAIINYGTGSFDFRRRINLQGKDDQFAEGSPNSSELAISLGAGLEYNNDEWSYGPYGRLSFSSAEVDAYREKASNPDAEGFGSVLSVDDQNIDSSTLVIGGQISRNINTGNAVYIPQFRLELEHRLDDSGREITAAFQNDPQQNLFTIEADDVDSDYLNLGVGSSAVFRNGKSGFVFYETRIGQDRLSQHWIKAGFRLEF